MRNGIAKCAVVLLSMRSAFFVEQHVATLKHQQGIKKNNAGSLPEQGFMHGKQHKDFANQLVRACASSDTVSAEKLDRQKMSSSFEINKYHVTDDNEKVN